MLKIFYRDSEIRFCGPEWSGEPGCPVVPARSGIAKVLQNPENSKCVYISGASEEDAFRSFVSECVIHEAAGGVVRGPGGGFLFIYRNGKWDLPKGHVEAGETLEETAIREVEEECGLHDLRLGEPVTVTMHIYRLGHHWILKRTAWFRMETDQTNIVPQAEEGIERAEWVSPEDLPEYIPGMYRSVAQVMETIKD